MVPATGSYNIRATKNGWPEVVHHFFGSQEALERGTMISIYLSEMLQPMVDSKDGVLLYYFISNRDRNRNTALTIMRGILFQWLSFEPHLAQHIKTYFEGSETTKYTIFSFFSLWRLFLIMLSQSGSTQVVCVLDGLDECEKKSLRQLLDALGDYISKAEETPTPRLKLICISRPQPVLLENKLGRYCRIKLDDSEKETRIDVERYIFAGSCRIKVRGKSVRRQSPGSLAGFTGRRQRNLFMGRICRG